MEGMIGEDDESSYEGWKRWDGYEITNHDQEETECENDEEDEERCELFDDTTQELPVCTVRRFKMIKYSFGQDEECVAVKEDKYEDLTSTSEDACRAYQTIFRMMDEGWMISQYGIFQFMDTAYWSPDLGEKKSTKLVKYLQSGNLEVLES
ncbi:hypothetical protein Tco_0464886 [Tanacetum coccineum]